MDSMTRPQTAMRDLVRFSSRTVPVPTRSQLARALDGNRMDISEPAVPP